jgi:hypothetical protein
MRLRHRLIPYIYSMAWRNYTTSLPLVTPVYYSHPEHEEAYQTPQQYWFGSELLAAPFTAPASRETGLSRQVVWLPPGAWFDFLSGERFTGGVWQPIYGSLDDIPLFAPAGAILPLAPETGWGGVDNPTALQIHIFAGADHSFELVEDDGHSQRYLDGHYAVTSFEQAWHENELVFSIFPARGDQNVLPAQRDYGLLVHGIANPDAIQLLRNDTSLPASFHYDPLGETLTLAPIRLQPGDALRLTISRSSASLLGGRDRRREKLRKYLAAFQLESWTKQKIEVDWVDILLAGKSLRSYTALSDAQRSVLESLI